MGALARRVSRSTVQRWPPVSRSIRPCMASPVQGAKRFLSARGPLWRVGRPYSMVRMKLHQVDLPDSLGA